MTTPLLHEPVLVSLLPERVEATMTIDPQEPIFAGHYPEFPIFPGVCVVECVHRVALQATASAGDEPVELAALESARFLGPIYPGDDIRIELAWHAGDGNGPRCRATVSTDDTVAARVRLKFRWRKVNGVR